MNRRRKLILVVRFLGEKGARFTFDTTGSQAEFASIAKNPLSRIASLQTTAYVSDWTKFANNFGSFADRTRDQRDIPVSNSPRNYRPGAYASFPQEEMMATEIITGGATALREPTAHCFETSDGMELFYRVWAPTIPTHKAVVLFHRGHEHSGRWQEFVDRIDLEDCWFFAWDARGHGRSPGPRGYADSFGQLVRDADEFMRHIARQYGIPCEDTAIVSQSVGSVVAAAWVHDYAPPIRALVLATPALRVKLYVPLAMAGLRMLHKLKPQSFIKSYVSPQMLTHDKAQAELYAADELISSQIATNILLELHDTSTRLIADAAAIDTPTLLLSSGKDWVVHRKPQDLFFRRLSSKVKEQEHYPDFYHSTFWEKDRDIPITRTREFLLRQFNAPTETASFLSADQNRYSKQVYNKLNTQLPWTSPKRWWCSAQKLCLTTLGRLSRGIQVGWQSGFDSGQSLDHVYRNRAEGFTPLGQLIDRIYLNSPGWRGIRQRKHHVNVMLDRAIDQTNKNDEPVRLLDIAAGPGRYVLEAIEKHSCIDISAVLCDQDEQSLAEGRSLAKLRGIECVDYRASDAFDRQSIACHNPRPNIAIVSGLYELFPNNGPVLESLRGLADSLPEGGVLIYTNQPWHPQQELIARVLRNREGASWIMRCRSQTEMDQLVESVGFQKLDMLIDNAGIFSVSMAIRKSD